MAHAWTSDGCVSWIKRTSLGWGNLKRILYELADAEAVDDLGKRLRRVCQVGIGFFLWENKLIHGNKENEPSQNPETWQENNDPS